MSNRINKSDKEILIAVYAVSLILLTILCAGVESGSGKVNNEELYTLLGVSKQSTTREIRIAFKKLALEKHPDKNKVFIIFALSHIIYRNSDIERERKKDR